MFETKILVLRQSSILSCETTVKKSLNLKSLTFNINILCLHQTVLIQP